MSSWNGTGSLLIACIEFILLINILVFSEKNKNNYLVMGIVALLMIYQTLEYIMCGLGYDSSYNAFLAFTDISFLPPLGLYFVLSFYNYKSKYLKLIFLPAIAFVFYYSTIIDQFNVSTCTVFYAIYKYPQGDLYGFFYYVPILITMYYLYTGMKKSADEKERHISKIMLIGYILISVPVMLAFILVFAGQTLLVHSIVSVMCKFAVILTYFALTNKNKHE